MASFVSHRVPVVIFDLTLSSVFFQSLLTASVLIVQIVPKCLLKCQLKNEIAKHGFYVLDHVCIV